MSRSSPPPRFCASFLRIALLAALLAGSILSAHAQAQRSGAFYGKVGAGLADYTGDFPAQNASHPFDLQEFTRGAGAPVLLAGEIGYQVAPHWAIAAGLQAGNYPIVGYGGGASGVEDSYRYTPYLLGRYTIGTPGQGLSPYVDLGINATVGGDRPPTSVGVGPSAGAGIAFSLTRSLSLYLESRFHVALPDEAVDGAGRAGANGAFDVVGQLLGAGIKVGLSSPAPPAVRAVEAPDTVEAGTPVTLAATVNEDEAARPLRYAWELGDGTTATGPTITHTYDRPGTYTVIFRARNSAGAARASRTVRVPRPSETAPAAGRVQIASLTATPNPVGVEEPVQFRSAVRGSSAPSYRWRFGDGATATGSAPRHAYGAPGQYTVRLKALNDEGSDTRAVSVQVRRRAQRPAAAPWRIVVASMRRQEGAETMARQYRTRFAGDELPVEIVAAETREGLRYRVVVGRFETDEAAQQALRMHAEALPSRAWTLRLSR